MDKKLNILVVDRATDSADALGDLLKEEGYHVAVAYDGQNAIEACRGKPFDLALVEIVLPEPGGLECVIEIRKMWPDISIYMITAGGHDHLTRKAISHGAIGTLNKPIDPARLVTIIEGMTSGVENPPAALRVVK